MKKVFLDSNIIFSGLREFLKNKGKLDRYYLKKIKNKCQYFFSTFAIQDVFIGIKKAKSKKDKVYGNFSDKDILNKLQIFLNYLNVKVLDSDKSNKNLYINLYNGNYIIDVEDNDDIEILIDALFAQCDVLVTNDKGGQSEKIKKDFGISVVSYNKFNP